jgi:hypothetical protein
MATTGTRSFAGLAYDNGDGSSTLVDPTHPLPVSAAGTGSSYQSSVATTRTNDTAAYAAGDVIGTGTGAAGAVLTFAAAGPSGGNLLITGADLMPALAAVPAGMTSFRLHLYDASPASALGDNAAWDLPSGDRANYLGYVDLGTPVDVGSTLWVQNDGIKRQVTLANASTTLYGYLVTVGGFTPAAQTVFTVNLKGLAV